MQWLIFELLQDEGASDFGILKHTHNQISALLNTQQNFGALKHTHNQISALLNTLTTKFRRS